MQHILLWLEKAFLSHRKREKLLCVELAIQWILEEQVHAPLFLRDKLTQWLHKLMDLFQAPTGVNLRLKGVIREIVEFVPLPVGA